LSSDTLSRRSLLFGLLALGGCGFAPAYAPGGVGEVLTGKVTVEAPQTLIGAGLRDRLRDRLGPVTTPRFTLATTVTTNRRAATISRVGDTTRFNITGSANWVLTETATGLTREGTAQTFTSYSATGSTVATQAAETDAEARLAVALADLIMARLLIAAADFAP
jgi:LPS-assembly lipoprotein